MRAIPLESVVGSELQGTWDSAPRGQEGLFCPGQEGEVGLYLKKGSGHQACLVSRASDS